MPILPNMGVGIPDGRELAILRQRFAQLDTSGDWKLSYNEMANMLRAGNPDMGDREIKALYNAIDKNHDGQVAFDEFATFIWDPHYAVEEVERASAQRGSEGHGRGTRSPAENHTHAESGSTAAEGGEQCPVCDWCKEPLARATAKPKSRTLADGSRVKTTTVKFVADEQVSFRLPGVDETVTLHADTACVDEYVQANALRCVHCRGPIQDHLAVFSVDGSSERQHLHVECLADFETIFEQTAPSSNPGSNAGHSRSGGGRPSPSSNRSGRAPSTGGSRHNGEGNRPRGSAGGQSAAVRSSPSPSSGGQRSSSRGGGGHVQVKDPGDRSRCYQCGQPFGHSRTSTRGSRTTTTRSTDARTELQLPGVNVSVTLHSEGSCIADYTQENALRCDQCHEPIAQLLKHIVLPWSDKQATLHEYCLGAYAEAKATKCARCRAPILEEGVRVRSGSRTSFFHAGCESRY